MTEMEQRLTNAVRGLTEVVEEIAKEIDLENLECWETGDSGRFGHLAGSGLAFVKPV